MFGGRKRLRYAVVAWLLVLTWLTTAGAQELQVNKGNDTAAILQDLQRQVLRMQEMIQQQNMEIQALKQSVAKTGEGEPVQAPDAPAFDLNTFQDMLGTSTDWIKGLRQGGDFRLRLDQIYFYNKDADHGATDRDRNRMRARIRYGFEKDLGDDFAAGFRLVTGTATDPNAQNTTLGNPGYFTYKPVFFDKLYARYTPSALKDRGPLTSATFGGGKVENPFLKYATTAVWDPDITPEGVYETLQLKLYDSPDHKLQSTVNLGQFILNENAAVNADAEMFGYQAGATYTTDYFKLEKPVSFTGALSFYQYINYYATVISPAGTGTSLLRTNFAQDDSPQVLDFYHQTSLELFKRKLQFFGNYTKNIRNIVSSGPGAGTNGYGIGWRYGNNKKPGDWELNWAYYYLEANATAAAFNDNEFGGPGYAGFTNRKGYKFGLTYRLTQSMEANVTGYVVSPVNDFSAASLSTSESVLRAQTDLVWKF